MVRRDMVSLSRPNPFKFFKGCFPQNLLSPLLNTLSHIIDLLKPQALKFLSSTKDTPHRKYEQGDLQTSLKYLKSSL